MMGEEEEPIAMKEFLGDDFLLDTQVALDLYENTAKALPIFDYHCHLGAQEIAEDRRFENITQLWLEGDHYKWRVMRAHGIDEKYITGDAPDYEKFQKWAETLESCIGNPLYVWSHLELKRYFGIDGVLGPQTAKAVWDACNALLQTEEYSARKLIERSNVVLVGTTEDPAGDLYYHDLLAKDETFQVEVIPSFRADNLITVHKRSWPGYMNRLSEVTGIKITGGDTLLEAVQSRIDYFDERGCFSSDQGLEPVSYMEYVEQEIDDIIAKALNGEDVSSDETSKYQTWIMQNLAYMYKNKNWAMQMRFGLLRETNGKKTVEVGGNKGFDSINDVLIAEPLSKLLNSINHQDMLPKTILYSLNTKDYDVLSTMAAAFQEGSRPGKIQLGAAWWYNDQKTGIVKQLTSLSDMGLLSHFIGMLTDSRSYLSYVRHEYFRRILCNMLGEWVEKGEFPNNEELLIKAVNGVCYENAVHYFKKE